MHVFTESAWIQPLKDNKHKVALNAFIEIVNYKLLKEENFTINLCKNG